MGSNDNASAAAELVSQWHRKGWSFDLLGVRVSPVFGPEATGTLYWSGSKGSESVVVAYTPGVAFCWVVRRSYWLRGVTPERVYRGEAATLDEAVNRVEMDEDMRTAVAS